MPSLEEQAILEGVSPDEAMQSGLVLSRLLKNPKTRAQALGLIKQNDPNLNVPEVDIPASFEAHLKPIQEQLTALAKENGELKLSNARKGILEDLVTDGLAANIAEAKLIEKFAVDEKIADYKSAAKFYKMSQQQAEPTADFTIMGGPLDMPENFKDIAKDPKRWAQNAGLAALNDYRKNHKAA
jgi:hypothetical protein